MNHTGTTLTKKRMEGPDHREIMAIESNHRLMQILKLPVAVCAIGSIRSEVDIFALVFGGVLVNTVVLLTTLRSLKRVVCFVGLIVVIFVTIASW